jgi:peptide/nickel transport system permease protein
MMKNIGILKSNIVQKVEFIKPYKWLFKNKASKFGIFLFLALIIFAIIGSIWTPYNPYYTGFPTNQPPSFKHLLGTTSVGQDIFSQLLYGAAPTLEIGLAAGFGILLLSLFAALAAGMSKGLIRFVIDGLINIFMVIPALLLIIYFGLFFLSKGSALGDIGIVFALSVTGWAGAARILRSQILSLYNRDFIVSSRLIGEKRITIIGQLTSNILPIVFSTFFFDALFSVLALTWVEFYGLGSINSINWGTMLYWSIDYYSYGIGAWWWFLSPAIMVAMVALSFSLINFGLDEIANPKLRSFSQETGKKTKKEVNS